MEIPAGWSAKLWSFISFLPFFLLLFSLGILKAALVGPAVVGIILIGNSAVIVGLWPAHFVWTYYCAAKTKRLGPALKIVVLVSLPVPLVLWPLFGEAGSLLGGIGYGFFAPLLATFEAVGENVAAKFYHCFIDGKKLFVASVNLCPISLKAQREPPFVCINLASAFTISEFQLECEYWSCLIFGLILTSPDECSQFLISLINLNIIGYVYSTYLKVITDPVGLA
ncbi:hypothetical protein CJ030_MR6G005858 [Morella rubra]|uniref:Uncharacterized protein n=1 Tax=Morella rubra TaxID=262757 RepID=A0A6A1V7B6_9ROSI|nr:hypothetical protein CJ030_MR6G005858 [Morella rubra]